MHQSFSLITAIRQNNVVKVLEILPKLKLGWFKRLDRASQYEVGRCVMSKEMVQTLWPFIKETVHEETSAMWVLKKHYISESEYPYGSERLNYCRYDQVLELYEIL